MQSIEMYFNTVIEKHCLFKEAVTVLVKEIPTLTPIAIEHKCRKLTKLHDDMVADKDYFFSLMEFVGPGILDTAYIGEFQRALNKSLESCNALYDEVCIYRNKMVSID